MSLVFDLFLSNSIFQIFDDFVVSGAADKTVLVHNVMVSILSLSHTAEYDKTIIINTIPLC